jgi:hypothetical protein
VPGRIVQYSLLERALPSPETLATLTARLSALVGEDRCGSPALLDTWRPDGFEMRRFAPSSCQSPVSSSQFATGEQSIARIEGSPASGFEPAFAHSSERRLSRRSGAAAAAESSEKRAASSEERAVSSLILRRFRPPIAIRVTVERGRPVRVAIDRRGMPGGHVECAAGPWRTSGGWWAHGSAAWDRVEWDAALSDGSICRLFHDRINDCWFLEAIFD